LAFLAPQK